MTLNHLQPYNSNFEIFKSSVKFDVGRSTKKNFKTIFFTKDIPIFYTNLRGLNFGRLQHPGRRKGAK